jgi:hypothetical protein
VGSASAVAAPRVTIGGTPAPGATITLNGSGFAKGTILQVRWDSLSTKLRLIWVASNGRFSARVRVPTGASIGNHVITLSRVSEAWISRTGGPSSKKLIPAAPYLKVPVTVSQAPAVAGVYGPGIGMDSLNNTHVGGPNQTTVSYRFRAATSSRLESIRVYIIGPSHSGYGAGTGGTWQVSVQADDGTSRHAPTGTALATASFRPVDDFPVIRWSSPASVTAGQLYHVVFRNVDASATANYASVDGIYMSRPTSPRQAAFSDLHWGQLRRYGSGAWSEVANTVPIMQLNYANGTTAGVGYMEVWVGSPRSISGSARVREAFTVSGSSRSVRSVSVRLARSSGSSPLTVRLETGSGTLLEQGTIPASAIASGSSPTWATLTFDGTHVLKAGTAYSLVLSAPSDTTYSIYVIRQGSWYDFSPTTYFGDGRAQYTSGSGWTDFSRNGGASGEGDLQFYFR